VEKIRIQNSPTPDLTTSPANMNSRVKSNCFAIFLSTLFWSTSFAADTFRVATYNVENYLDQPTESRPHPKSARARAKVCESICSAFRLSLAIMPKMPIKHA
jgi:hypothetical protein